MNKNTIKVIIITVCFAASGLVLYFGMFKKSPTQLQVAHAPHLLGGTAAVGGASGAVSASQPILPNGNTFDVKKVIDTRRFNYGVVTYPTLNPAEVGIDENNLISTPPVVAAPGGG